MAEEKTCKKCGAPLETAEDCCPCEENICCHCCNCDADCECGCQDKE